MSLQTSVRYWPLPARAPGYSDARKKAESLTKNTRKPLGKLADRMCYDVDTSCRLIHRPVIRIGTMSRTFHC